MTSTRMDTAAFARLLGDWASFDDRLPDSLAEAVMDAVDAGLMPTGVELPPQRDISAALGVSRGTVNMAAQILEARGYLEARQGSGSRIRPGSLQQPAGAGQARFFTFTDTPADVIDLSSGALPASPVAREVLASSIEGELQAYLATDGYFPAGLPMLRHAIADQLTSDGIPTAPAEVMVTSGGQEALGLAIRLAARPGDLVLVEEPTYRGALEALGTWGARVEGVPLENGGIAVDLVARAVRRKPAALYCQTSIHNPTGNSMDASARQALADVVNRSSLTTIEDCSSYDITVTGTPARTLAGLVDPDLLISVGTLSKLFWGGLRVGWIRAGEGRLRSLLEMRKSLDLATSVPSQLWSVRMLARAEEARRQRRDMLVRHLQAAGPAISEYFPEWTWGEVRGGSGLWVDTHTDALKVTEVAQRSRVKLVAGPSFSTYNAFRTMIRLPVWQEADVLSHALDAVAAALHGRAVEGAR